MGAGNRIDRAIGLIAPGWAAKRAHARYLLSVYGAAEKTRLTNDWKSATVGEDAILADTPVINSRARRACRDDWCARAIVRAYVRHVVGNGITPRSAARDPQTDMDLEEFNKLKDLRFKRWSCDPKRFDIEGKRTLLWLERQGISELVKVGNAFLVPFLRRGPDGIELCTQTLSVEQLDRNKTRHEGRDVKQGVEVDSNNVPVAYHFYPSTESGDNHSGNPTRYTADRVLHLIDAEWSRQLLGESKLAAVLKKLRYLQHYDEYNLVRAKQETMIGAIITGGASRPTGWNFGVKLPSGDDTTDANDNTKSRLEPGMMHYVPDGTGVHFLDPKTPGGMYEAFVGAQARQASAGAGSDYTTVARDMIGLSYAGGRQNLIENDKEMDPLQLLLIWQWLSAVDRMWTVAEILGGRLPAPNYLASPEWTEAYHLVDWQPPAKPWVDPKNQAEAIEKALSQKTTSIQIEANRLGLDWRDVIRQHIEAELFEQNERDKHPKLKPKQLPPQQDPNGDGDTEDDSEDGGSDDDSADD